MPWPAEDKGAHPRSLQTGPGEPHGATPCHGHVVARRTDGSSSPKSSRGFTEMSSVKTCPFKQSDRRGHPGPFFCLPGCKAPRRMAFTCTGSEGIRRRWDAWRRPSTLTVEKIQNILKCLVGIKIPTPLPVVEMSMKRDSRGRY